MSNFKSYTKFLNEQLTNEAAAKPKDKDHGYKDAPKPSAQDLKDSGKNKEQWSILRSTFVNPNTNKSINLETAIKRGESSNASKEDKDVYDIAIKILKAKHGIDRKKDKDKSDIDQDKKTIKLDDPKIKMEVDSLNKLKSKNQKEFDSFKKSISKIADPKTSESDRANEIKKLADAGLITRNELESKNRKVYINTAALGLSNNDRKVLSGPSGVSPNSNSIVNVIISTAENNKIELTGKGGKSTSSLGKKTTTADKVSEREAEKIGKSPTQQLIIKKEKTGAIIGKTKYDLQQKPDDKTKALIIQSFTERGLSKTDAENEYKLTVKSIDKYNEFVTNPEKYFGSTDVKITAWYDDKGKEIDQTTDDGKLKLKSSMLKGLANSTKEAHPEISKKIDELSKKSGKLSKEEFEKEIKSVFKDIINSPETRGGAPDIAEIVTALHKLNNGSEVYLPKASNFPLGDVIAIKPIKQLNKIKSATEMAEAVQSLYVSMDLASVKYEEGGASSSSNKIYNTVFSHKTVRKNLYKIVNEYYKVIWDKTTKLPALKSIEKELEAMCKEYEFDFKAISKNIESELNTRVAASSKKYTEYAKNFNVRNKAKNIQISKQDLDEYLKMLSNRWRTYILSGKIMTKAYNKYADSQNFGNIAYHPKNVKGKAEDVVISESNGITSMCRLKFDHSSLGDTGKPNNTYPTRMINMSRKDFDSKRIEENEQITFKKYSEFLFEKNLKF